MDDPTYRAVRKYRKGCQLRGEPAGLPGERSGMMTVGARQLIVLKDETKILAVYSYLHGRVTRIKREFWPAGID